MEARVCRMKEMHRAAGLEAEVLKGKRVVAEGEVVKLKEQLNKVLAVGTGQRGEGGGTNLKTRLDAAAVRSTRKGLKATPRRDLGDGDAASGGVNERFQHVEAQKKDLRNYKKSGLEMLCRETGLKLRAIELMIHDLTEHRANKAFGSNNNDGKEADKEVPVHEVSEDSPPVVESSKRLQHVAAYMHRGGQRWTSFFVYKGRDGRLRWRWTCCAVDDGEDSSRGGCGCRCPSFSNRECGRADEGSVFEAAAEATAAKGVGRPGLHHHIPSRGSAVCCYWERFASSGDATLVDAAESWRDLGGFTGCNDAIEDYFREKLRMSRRVFMEISEACAPHVQRQVMFNREPLQSEQIVAYTLYRWATGESYDNSTSSFGMGRTSGVRAVCNSRHFEGVRGKDIVADGVDCTHIYVDKPANALSENYFDRKHRFSVIAQVVVDLDLRVLDVFVGYPGSCQDIRVIQLLSLSRRAEEGLLFRGPPVMLPGGVMTNGYILGDNGYPPSEWVVVPYGGINQHPDEERFDTKQKVARGAVERAFGRWKGMWRLFLRTHKTNLESLPQQFTAVCILHNILLDAGIEFNENLLWEVDANGSAMRRTVSSCRAAMLSSSGRSTIFTPANHRGTSIFSARVWYTSAGDTTFDHSCPCQTARAASVAMLTLMYNSARANPADHDDDLKIAPWMARNTSFSMLRALRRAGSRCAGSSILKCGTSFGGSMSIAGGSAHASPLAIAMK
ncbi:hypothetical protein CBR_g22333 [Chara braunii]|uniref:DDE Tnp4 domain-containing protein n=1 Tax=Chara braunii TaxID=69332 RepID=A0A388JUP9_CHABU|nr:hypothetical protein CBR_g22333 [Chara braunii]|eukprot:GBG61536.1 hypothetical protein CBR_g22333 [Chara braunii]